MLFILSSIVCVCVCLFLFLFVVDVCCYKITASKIRKGRKRVSLLKDWNSESEISV